MRRASPDSVASRTVILAGLAALVAAGATYAATASPALRILRAKPNDIVLLPSQKLACTVVRDAFHCYETGGFPRLAFYATPIGGEAGRGTLYVWRTPYPGGPMEELFRAPRRK